MEVTEGFAWRWVTRISVVVVVVKTHWIGEYKNRYGRITWKLPRENFWWPELEQWPQGREKCLDSIYIFSKKIWWCLLMDWRRWRRKNQSLLLYIWYFSKSPSNITLTLSIFGSCLYCNTSLSFYVSHVYLSQMVYYCLIYLLCIID